MLAPPVLCCAVLLRACGPALWPSLCAARPRRGAVQGCDVGSDQGDHHEAHLLLGGRRLLLAARRRRGAHELAAGAPPHARGERGPRGVPRLPAGAEAVPVGRGRGAWRLLPRALPGAPPPPRPAGPRLRLSLPCAALLACSEVCGCTPAAWLKHILNTLVWCRRRPRRSSAAPAAPTSWAQSATSATTTTWSSQRCWTTRVGWWWGGERGGRGCAAVCLCGCAAVRAWMGVHGWAWVAAGGRVLPGPVWLWRGLGLWLSLTPAGAAAWRAAGLQAPAGLCPPSSQRDSAWSGGLRWQAGGASLPKAGRLGGGRGSHPPGPAAVPVIPRCLTASRPGCCRPALTLAPPRSSRLLASLAPASANTGVDVSGGRVTKAFEVIPSMAEPLASTKLTKARRASGRPPLSCSGGSQAAWWLAGSIEACVWSAGRVLSQGRAWCVQAVVVEIKGGVDGPTWEHQPVLELDVESTAGFILYTLVKVPGGGWGTGEAGVGLEGNLAGGAAGQRRRGIGTGGQLVSCGRAPA